MALLHDIGINSFVHYIDYKWKELKKQYVYVEEIHNQICCYN
jgi:hypothetical protein